MRCTLSTGELSYIGDLGINNLSGGAEWFEDQLFLAVQNGTSFDFEVGTVDVATGMYTAVFTLGEGIADDVGTGLAIVWEPTTVPSLDIKPGSCPNPLNRNSHGVLPVAIVGATDFDVTQIDAETLVLTRADGVGGSVTPLMGPPGPGIRIEDVATPFEGEPCDCHEMGGDGIDDLSMKFSTPTVVEVLELSELEPGATVELVVSGNLLDGTPFTASDCVRLVPSGRGSGRRASGLAAGD